MRILPKGHRYVNTTVTEYTEYGTSRLLKSVSASHIKFEKGKGTVLIFRTDNIYELPPEMYFQAYDGTVDFVHEIFHGRLHFTFVNDKVYFVDGWFKLDELIILEIAGIYRGQLPEDTPFTKI